MMGGASSIDHHSAHHAAAMHQAESQCGFGHHESNLHNDGHFNSDTHRHNNAGQGDWDRVPYSTKEAMLYKARMGVYISGSITLCIDFALIVISLAVCKPSFPGNVFFAALFMILTFTNIYIAQVDIGNFKTNIDKFYRFAMIRLGVGIIFTIGNLLVVIITVISAPFEASFNNGPLTIPITMIGTMVKIVHICISLWYANGVKSIGNHGLSEGNGLVDPMIPQIPPHYHQGINSVYP